jgi:hypothetical protein
MKTPIYITRTWFRIFGYGLSWTKQPRFSHRMGLKGFKLFGLYFDFLKPLTPKRYEYTSIPERLCSLPHANEDR